MKKFLLPALLFAAASLTGCTSYNVSQPIARWPAR
ncbi:putative lipoprotein [Pseudomonas aeruginosa]|nr:putative lipoprotein [Pseudomonas aeruginosa]